MSQLMGLSRGLCIGAHAGQVRKYTGKPYHAHPIEVEALLAYAGESENARAAGLLHDTLEDTALTYEDLRREVGRDIADIVRMVTDVSTHADGNRAVRKGLDKAHLSKASPEGVSVKLADLISNTSSIVQYDPNFAKVYMQEKRELLKVLRGGNKYLYADAEKIVIEYFRSIEA